MEDKFYFPHEFREIVQQVLFDEVSMIIHAAAPYWEEASAEVKIATIEGMYILARAIDRHFAGSGDEKKEEE